MSGCKKQEIWSKGFDHDRHRQQLSKSVLNLFQAGFQVRCQQAMEQVFSRFPAHRESSRAIGPRVQSALHRLTDSHVLVIDALADGYALSVAFRSRFAHIVDIEIEDHGTAIN